MGVYVARRPPPDLEVLSTTIPAFVRLAAYYTSSDEAIAIRNKPDSNGNSTPDFYANLYVVLLSTSELLRACDTTLQVPVQEVKKALELLEARCSQKRRSSILAAFVCDKSDRLSFNC